MKLVLNEDTMHSETLCHYVILEYLNALKIMKTSNERFRGVYILLVDQLQRELKLSPYMSKKSSKSREALIKDSEI